MRKESDRALREQNSLAIFEEDLPVHAPPAFRDFFVANMRLQVLFTIVPVALIILLHDIYKGTVPAVPGILEGLKKRGYTVVTVSELMAPAKPEAGKIYKP